MAEPASTSAAPPPEQDRSNPGLVGRALGAGRALVSVHLELAQEEAARDAGRVSGAAGLLLVAGALLVGALALVDVALVALCQNRLGLPLGQAALLVAGGHLVVALPVALLALRRLKRPLLEKTRGRMRATLGALRGS